MSFTEEMVNCIFKNFKRIMRKLLFRLPLLLLLGILSCTDDVPTQVDKAPAIYGTVVDVQGNPIKDAEIRVVFKTRSYDSSYRYPEFLSISPNPVIDNSMVSLYSPYDSRVIIELFRGIDTNQRIATLLDSTIFGPTILEYKIFRENRLDSTQALPNGIYTVRINKGTMENNFLLNRPLNSGVITKTDNKGNFTLDYNIFNKILMPRLSTQGMFQGFIQISDFATFQVRSKNLEAKLDTNIDRNKNTNLKFTLR